MVNYRRNRLAGGSYFFTVALNDRRSEYLISHVDALRSSFRHARSRRPFTIDAIVILPDHLHVIWTLPPNDSDYPARWRWIKSHFTHALLRAGVSLKQRAHREYDLWQRRYWEHTIRDEHDLIRHVEYIHYNPVKHGYVESVANWPYSSFHRYMKQNLYPIDWGDQPLEFDTVGRE